MSQSSWNAFIGSTPVDGGIRPGWLIRPGRPVDQAEPVLIAIRPERWFSLLVIR
jgi:hypothetical protein